MNTEWKQCTSDVSVTFQVLSSPSMESHRILLDEAESGWTWTTKGPNKLILGFQWNNMWLWKTLCILLSEISGVTPNPLLLSVSPCEICFGIVDPPNFHKLMKGISTRSSVVTNCFTKTYQSWLFAKTHQSLWKFDVIYWMYFFSPRPDIINTYLFYCSSCLIEGEPWYNFTLPEKSTR
jgi:hypothetical protein